MLDEPIDFAAIENEASTTLLAGMKTVVNQLESKYRIPRRIAAAIAGKAAVILAVSMTGNSTGLPADSALPVARNALKELQRLSKNHIKRGGKKRRR